MEDREINFSSRELFSGSNLGEWPSSCPMVSNFDLDDIWKNTHACNHPGMDNTHTKLVVDEEEVDDDKVYSTNNNNDNSNETVESTDKKFSSNKRPVGNREAVKKYREKKKAQASSLEDEVVKLRAVNQQLLKKLQSQAVLEAEIARLKCLLVDIRGRIEGEIGSFPYQKVVNPNVAANLSLPGGYFVTPCNGQCGNDVYCLRRVVEGKGGHGTPLTGPHFSNCDLENLQCLGNQHSGVNELPGCEVGNGLGNGPSNVNSSGARKKRGAYAATAS